ncbi:MAG: arginine--tRNA ligase [Candidatus Jacksonbacteria bacterium RIFOXYC2_FULL_44_29]|nr:MAG: Arginine-tRNA ligase [Parcubacteria group bacterium GW2011_GWC2_44_22]OGY75201.1 MAG: arginine--tRNA ligase [Candidatus Jacksonbacteria bacterium RIFOXYA2_FULL_43_12]OGY75877.1 MAG: arginine--tRNA ligase [Candidatus Jacksonbacteria bacterium RIFOXYB2_FULL_44_15]OGY77650.1 MAG: arginine--tRNA ligase [Candidatus Jacksonbacteria bacterium RIFOXYC2_FULL_44_29]OGY79537.1 MAG: arginine--tRNA ligase [Candidatus Jacksonbacteria bacterium RIFOXYD2_FULL_43_21]HBH46439.1 arginine--tRNA ligase [Ca
MFYHDLKLNIQDLIRQAVKKEIGIDLDKIRLDLPPSPDLGDLSFSCFEVAGRVKQSPAEIASSVASAFATSFARGYGRSKKASADKSLVPRNDTVKAQAVGPYVNFFIKDDVLFSAIISAIIEQADNVGDSQLGQDQEVVLEYSSPNTNKPLHIGHLRNNSLGDSLARILKSQGYKVHKVGVINDRGAHICKSMLMYQKYGQDQLPADRKPDHFVGHFYQMFEQKMVEDSTLADQAKEMLIKWEDGDPEVRALWKKMNDWIYAGWKVTYDRLGNTFEKLYYESDIYQKGKEVVAQGLTDGVFYKLADGAVEINLESENLDKKILMRSNGTSVYITQDLYLAELRGQEFPEAHKFIYVVGMDQEYHFKVLFSILKKLGLEQNFYHLSYGIVRLPSGKMSSRAGTVVNADDLIDEVVGLAMSEIKKRTDEVNSDLAESIGLAALKYYLLHVAPRKDITFDAERAVSFEGETGPYIQYTYARMQSIKIKNEKLKIKNSQPKAGPPRAEKLKVILNSDEREIINKLGQFPEVLERSAENYDPSLMAHYLFELAAIINSFYHEHQVLKAAEDEREQRLMMLEAVSIVIKKGLNLLGIDAVERM